jgi:DNA-binding transcriptional regulator YhcF (GntR family)
VIAAELRTAILDSTLPPGAPLPTVKQLAAHHHVAASTVHRATVTPTPVQSSNQPRSA